MYMEVDPIVRKIRMFRACCRFQWPYMSQVRRDEAEQIMLLGFKVEKEMGYLRPEYNYVKITNEDDRREEHQYRSL